MVLLENELYILYLFMAASLHVICVYMRAHVLQIFLAFEDHGRSLIRTVTLILPT